MLGCAGMADLAADAAAPSSACRSSTASRAAVKQAEALVALGLSTSKRGAYARPLEKPYHGVLQSFAPQAIVLG